MNEDSIQGIVMEQEELSDSDDGGDDSEDVEFECEEMADSDDDQLLVTFLFHFILPFFLAECLWGTYSCIFIHLFN